jgi:hypothetical protein
MNPARSSTLPYKSEKRPSNARTARQIAGSQANPPSKRRSRFGGDETEQINNRVGPGSAQHQTKIQENPLRRRPRRKRKRAPLRGKPTHTENSAKVVIRHTYKPRHESSPLRRKGGRTEQQIRAGARGRPELGQSLKKETRNSLGIRGERSWRKEREGRGGSLRAREVLLCLRWYRYSVADEGRLQLFHIVP